MQVTAMSWFCMSDLVKRRRKPRSFKAVVLCCEGRVEHNGKEWAVRVIDRPRNFKSYFSLSEQLEEEEPVQVRLPKCS